MASITIKVPNWLDRLFVWPILLYRLCKFGYAFRRIYLGEGNWAILDKQDYYRLGNYKWYVNGNGFKFYAFRNIILGPGKTRMLSMHRDVMGFPKGMLVDHRNHDTLDNRRENLRLATHSQNTCNKQDKRKGCSSQYRGVSFDRKRKYWNVQVVREGEMVYFGRYKDEVEAAKAYDEAAKKYHGEFARLNFPD
ncbi:MAG: HNH endonuclease [Sedimentisphaerales bacterium]